MILILILYFCLACGFAFGKAALTYMPPLLFVGIRMLIAGFLLVGYQFFFKKERLRIEPQDRSLFAGMCIFHIYGAYVLEYWAMQYVSSFVFRERKKEEECVGCKDCDGKRKF